MQKQEPAGEVPGISASDINVSGSQGVFAGSGNQYNNWAQKSPHDPAAMRDLNPYVAVNRLQQLSHDELVDFFARAKPDDVGDIIAAFWESDEARVIAVLGDLKSRKAMELLLTLGRDHFLAELPWAADSIFRKAASLKWTDAGSLQRFSRGYVKKYKNGHIFCSRHGLVAAITGEIDDYWTGRDGALGFPAKDQETAPSSPFGTEGILQEFVLSTVYSSSYGVFEAGIDYEDEGGSGGWLGFPTGENEGDHSWGLVQPFEGGALCAHRAEDGIVTFAARREVISALPNDGWRPTSKETSTESSSGIQGTVQHFEVKLGSGTYETAVYTSAKHPGPVMIDPDIWDYYSKLGAEKSWLGLPVVQANYDLAGTQGFEAGRISWVTLISGASNGERNRRTSVKAERLDPDHPWITEEDVQRAAERMRAAVKEDEDRHRAKGD